MFHLGQTDNGGLKAMGAAAGFSLAARGVITE